MEMKTITLAEVHSVMTSHFGPPAKVGWLCAIKDGQVVMCAGKGAHHVLLSNAQASSMEVRKIVK